jgi:hypothetical protein
VNTESSDLREIKFCVQSHSVEWKVSNEIPFFHSEFENLYWNDDNAFLDAFFFINATSSAANYER